MVELLLTLLNKKYCSVLILAWPLHWLFHGDLWLGLPSVEESVSVCVSLQWHSCSTEPGQVVGSQAGSHTRLLAFLGFSHICLGCRCSSWLKLFIPLLSLLGGPLASPGLMDVWLLHVKLISPQTQFANQGKSLFRCLGKKNKLDL